MVSRTVMRAFHSDDKIKEKYIARVCLHRELDELVKRGTGENGKGCAVWCTLNEYDHAAYETELGIPESLAHLEDRIFEELPDELALEWPETFLSAIPVGSDLSLVHWKFLHWLLTDSALLDDGGRDDVREAIEKCAEVILPACTGGDIDESAARAAASAAWSAAESAAWSAAERASRAAESAAWSAENAAESAARGGEGGGEGGGERGVERGERGVERGGEGVVERGDRGVERGERGGERGEGGEGGGERGGEGGRGARRARRGKKWQSKWWNCWKQHPFLEFMGDKNDS